MRHWSGARLRVDQVIAGCMTGTFRLPHEVSDRSLHLRLQFGDFQADIQLDRADHDLEQHYPGHRAFRWMVPVPEDFAYAKILSCAWYYLVDGGWQFFGRSIKISSRWIMIPRQTEPIISMIQLASQHDKNSKLASSQAAGKPADIILLAPIDWAWRKQRYQLLCEEWRAMGLRIAYVSPETVNSAVGTNLVLDDNNLVRFAAATVEPHDLATSTLPLRAAQTIARALKNTGIFKAGYSKVCVAFPNWLTLALALEPHQLVYDCADLHSAFDHVNVGDAEQHLVEEADLIFVTSKALGIALEQRYAIDRPTLSMNGVTNQWLTSAVKPDRNPPTIGYVGALEAWIDFEFIWALARARPHWQFEIVGSGPSQASFNTPPSNVRLLGEMDRSTLQLTMRHWSVGLIPFKKKLLTEMVNPVKYFEYLAMGCIVVGAETEAIKELNFDYTIATQDVEIAIAFIETSLLTPKGTRRDANFKVLTAHTWAARAQLMWELMDVA